MINLDVKVIEDDADNAVETEADDSDQGQKVKFHNGDPELPIFSWTDCEDDEEIVSILLNPPRDKVCKKVPLACQQNASFVIDTRSLKHPNDWKSDDLGSFHMWDGSTKVSLVSLMKCAFFQSRAHLEVLRPQFSSRKTTGLITSIAILSVEASSCGVVKVKGGGT